MPAASMAASVSSRSRSGSSPGRSPQALIGGRPRLGSGRGTLARVECSEPVRLDALSANDPFGARAPLGQACPITIDWPSWAIGSTSSVRRSRSRSCWRTCSATPVAGSSGAEDVETLAAWRPGVAAEAEIPFMPSRVILQDLTGVPAVVDLAVMRDAMAELGGDPAQGQPARARPTSSSTTRSRSTSSGRPAPSPSTSNASTSATSSATSCCAGPRRRSATCGSCRPGPASCTRSTSSSWPRSCDGPTTGPVAFPDTLVGTDSHTTMINALGVLGYGVGGIEAEAVLLGQPLYQPMPNVVGVRLTGELPRGSTATDLVLVVTDAPARPRRGRRRSSSSPATGWPDCRSPTGRRSAT